MGTKKTKKEETPAPAAKTAPKRKMAVRPPEPPPAPKAPAKPADAKPAAAKPAAKPAPAPVAEKPAKAVAKKPVKKVAPAPAAPAAPAAETAPAPTAAPAEISIEAIALRAYFISEKRQTEGQPGDHVSDWVEAERQLRAEQA